MKKTYLLLLLLFGAIGVFWLTSRNNNKLPVLKQSNITSTKTTDIDMESKQSNTILISPTQSLNLIRETTVHHKLRVNPAPAMLSGGSLKDKLEFLKSEAFGGKPALAYSLASELLNCLNLPEGDTSKSAGDPGLTSAERCRGLDSSDYSSGSKLLQYAADEGDSNAAYAYFGFMSIWMNHNPNLRMDENFIASLKFNTMSYLQRAAANGNVDSTNQLAYIYQDGIITKPDPVVAYAYMSVVATSGLYPGTSRVLAIWGNNLSQDQLNAARARSRHMGNH